MADEVATDARSKSFKFSDGEIAKVAGDGLFNQFGFCSARTFDLAGALFKFATGAADDGEKEIQPRDKVVFAFMPALRTALQGFVVIFLGFLGEPFKTDVAPYFVAVLV